MIVQRRRVVLACVFALFLATGSVDALAAIPSGVSFSQFCSVIPLDRDIVAAKLLFRDEATYDNGSHLVNLYVREAATYLACATRDRKVLRPGDNSDTVQGAALLESAYAMYSAAMVQRSIHASYIEVLDDAYYNATDAIKLLHDPKVARLRTYAVNLQRQIEAVRFR